MLLMMLNFQLGILARRLPNSLLALKTRTIRSIKFSLGFVILAFPLLRFNLDGLTLLKRYEIYLAPAMLLININHLALCIDQNRSLVSVFMIFLTKMHAVGDQLALSKPIWVNQSDAILFLAYRDRLRVMQFLMTLSFDFKQVHISFLHQDPSPKLEVVVAELLSEETRLATLRIRHLTTSTNTILAIFSSTSPRQISCCYRYGDSHEITNCPKLWYKNSKANQFKLWTFQPRTQSRQYNQS